MTFSICIISKKRTDNGIKGERKIDDVICKRDLIKFNTVSYHKL